MAQLAKNLPAMQETQVQSLGLDNLIMLLLLLLLLLLSRFSGVRLCATP